MAKSPASRDSRQTSLTVEIDNVDAEEWHRLLQEFDDASIFQAWAYGSARWGKNNLCHAVIRDGGEVVGLAQAVLFGIPLLGKVLAYVIFGPVCHRRGDGAMERLKSTIGALREEYVVRRGLCLRLRLWPYAISVDLRAALLAEGTWQEARPLHTTYILDLSLPESQLRSAMDKKWRANLRKAEQSGLMVSQHDGRDGIPLFVDLHRQMRERKHFASEFDAMLPTLYRLLAEPLQPRIFVCWRGRVPVAAAIVSAIGDRAFYLNGASGDAALEVRGGYFLQWAIVRWLKGNGRYRWYDLHGAASSPGVRQFKKGLVGARAPEIPLNELEARGRHLSALLVGAGTRLYEAHRRLKGPWTRLSRRR